MPNRQQQADPSARSLHDTTASERLVRAILDRRTVNLMYHGLRRVVEPHLIGIHEAGEPMLVAYQTGGFSHSGDLPGWRTFITTEIEAAEPLDETFTPRSDFSPWAHAMVEVFARAATC